MNNQFGQEFLLYITPSGKRKSAVISSNEEGIARIKRMTLDSIELLDISFDFFNDKCTFTCPEPAGKDVPASIQHILSGFLIQYHPQSFAFFTYRKPKK